MPLGWRDALMKLHRQGWDTDEIDQACEALHEACSEGDYEGSDILDLPPKVISRLLGAGLPGELAGALRIIASLRAQAGPEADELQRALYDLDAFAYAYAGDD